MYVTVTFSVLAELMGKMIALRLNLRKLATYAHEMQGIYFICQIFIFLSMQFRHLHSPATQYTQADGTTFSVTVIDCRRNTVLSSVHPKLDNWTAKEVIAMVTLFSPPIIMFLVSTFTYSTLNCLPVQPSFT